MAAKCAFIEKVGAVYYVRKRIPRAWKGRVDGEVLRLSLRTKDRTQALKRGLEALAVFEELLSMGPEEALKHLTRQLIDEQLLKPKEMTGADLVRRRALANVGAKIIRRAREELGLGENLDAIYQELVLLSRATLEGEALYTSRPNLENDSESQERHIDLSGFDAVFEMLGAQKPARAAKAEKRDRNAPRQPHRESSEPAATNTSEEEVAYTLRYLLNDYLGRQGKSTGSDNRANLERAVKLFEDLCPEVKTLAAPAIPLQLWDELHEFAQHIPKLRGHAKPENLVEFTRKLQAEKKDYPKLDPRTVNSNYLGAVTRLVRHGARRRLFAYDAPYMSVSESKRATIKKARVPFSSEEITAISRCPVYASCAARHRRYTS